MLLHLYKPKHLQIYPLSDICKVYTVHSNIVYHVVILKHTNNTKRGNEKPEIDEGQAIERQKKITKHKIISIL